MKETFRWFGPNDPVRLSYIRQAGASGVVTALHQIPNGEIWPLADIKKTKNEIEASGLEWTFIESIPIHENIKLGTGDCLQRIENYKQSLRNIAQSGVKNVCYNFMPVLDWTRTQLHWELDHGGTALRFDKVDMAIFEWYLLKRESAQQDYSEEIMRRAAERFSKMTGFEKNKLQDAILKGLPGTVDDLTIPVFKKMIAQYQGMTHKDLKANLAYFLNAIIPIAEEQGIKMAIHPDDPPFDIMGLPRIIKSEDDLEDLVAFIDSPSNGITFCTGSLGANSANDLPKMIRKFADRIHFLHLRNVRREADGSFYEDNHLEGSSDMFAIVKAVLEVENQRDVQLPMRPDHGHQLLHDLNAENFYSGYTAIGRLKGLAELRGLAMGISKSVKT